MSVGTNTLWLSRCSRAVDLLKLEISWFELNLLKRIVGNPQCQHWRYIEVKYEIKWRWGEEN